MPNKPQPLGSILLLLSSFLFSLTVAAGENPFTPRAHLIRYWNNKIINVPRSEFLLGKASPLSAADSASFARLAEQNSLSTHLVSFCKKANLLCFPDVPSSSSPNLAKHSSDVHFATYSDKNFTNYGTDLSGGFDSFKNYSGLDNFPPSFRRYSRDSTGHSDRFSAYIPDANVVTETFNTYGTGATGGGGEFNHYAEGNDVPTVAFTTYSADGNGRQQSFSAYSNEGNLGGQNFAGYGKNGNGLTDSFASYGNHSNAVGTGFSIYSESGNGGSDNFTSYADNVNLPDLNFTSYSADGNGRHQSVFSSYSDNSNAGSENFTSYGKDGDGLSNSFTIYGNNSGEILSGFSAYSESGEGGGGDNFTSYGDNQDLALNTFKNYGDGGNDTTTESFSSYGDHSLTGAIDSFHSYAKNSNSEEVKFSNYGQSTYTAYGRTHDFSAYGKGANGQSVGFQTYGPNNNTFKDYAKNGTVTFSDYNRTISSSQLAGGGGKTVNKWIDPHKFFREEKLKTGTVMPMPDIKDKMPARSFLPRSILSKLPFSSSKISDLKRIFHASDNPSVESMLNAALHECERAPSPGETKRCVGSAEDMIDFAVSVLGNSVELRTTESTGGSKHDIMIGEVRGINGGKVTKSVSCHQSLYPYLLYYCHSVPRVRVYQADILDPNSKSKINRGVAICHLDTSAWSATHGAFLALGSGPGKIEVCHWIFENDLTWTVAD